RAQAEFFPDQPGGWLTFPYPPFVAAAYVPLTLFSFKTAYALHSLIMAACCVAALALLLPALPRLRGSFLPCAAATLTFYPMVRAVMGGQNTAQERCSRRRLAWSMDVQAAACAAGHGRCRDR